MKRFKIELDKFRNNRMKMNLRKYELLKRIRSAYWKWINIVYVQCKSDLYSFSQAVVVSIQLYRCTIWTLTKRMEKKLDGDCTRMLWVILNKSWKQHPTKQQMYGYLRSITKTIQVRWTRHAWHCRRSRDERISDILLWTPSHGRAKAGRPARTYIKQLCADTECSLEDLLEPMDDRNCWTGHCRRSRDELISDILLWTLSHGRAKAGRPSRTYIQ